MCLEVRNSDRSETNEHTRRCPGDAIVSAHTLSVISIAASPSRRKLCEQLRRPWFGHWLSSSRDDSCSNIPMTRHLPEYTGTSAFRLEHVRNGVFVTPRQFSKTSPVFQMSCAALAVSRNMRRRSPLLLATLPRGSSASGVQRRRDIVHARMQTYCSGYYSLSKPVHRLIYLRSAIYLRAPSGIYAAKPAASIHRRRPS